MGARGGPRDSHSGGWGVGGTPPVTNSAESYPGNNYPHVNNLCITLAVALRPCYIATFPHHTPQFFRFLRRRSPPHINICLSNKNATYERYDTSPWILWGHHAPPFYPWFFLGHEIMLKRTCQIKVFMI